MEYLFSKPMLSVPKRLGCPTCGFCQLEVEEISEDGTIRWKCLRCGQSHYKLWRCGEFAAEEYDS